MCFLFVQNSQKPNKLEKKKKITTGGYYMLMSLCDLCSNMEADEHTFNDKIEI